MSEASIPLLSKEDQEPSPIPRPERSGRSRWSRALIAIIIGITLSVFLHLGASRQFEFIRHHIELESCPTTDAIPFKAPRNNVWKNLDVEEATGVRKWLFDPARGLNLTRTDEADASDNFIHVVDAYKPPKDLTLAYLSDPSATFPKYAHAVINHGPAEIITDYLIGPLPISNLTNIRPLSEIYHNPIPLNGRNVFNWTAIRVNMYHFMEPIDDITRDLFNGSVLDDTLSAAGHAPMSYDGSWTRSWIQLRRNTPGSWLTGIDFFMRVDMTGTDHGEYKILAYVHDRKLYHTSEELRVAWERGELKRSMPEPYDWATRSIQGNRRDLDDRAGPRTVQFDGARYRLDEEEQYISWMGWAFYTSFERDMGLHLWDINFRGERIIYELSPQEAMAQYSGDDPHQASTVWLDRAFGMGGMVREVILGYDCPADAILLNATVHDQGSSTRRNAICVFERESGRPLSRHTGQGRNEMGAVKGYELVVRSVSTVGNYDYLFDYTFQLDGTIEIRLSASGYLQGGLWNEEQSHYGHQIHGRSMGSLHDHVINYKIDFDIAGLENSFMAVSLETEDKAEPWFDDDWGPVTHQQRMVRRLLDQESLLEYPHNMEGAYVITNENATNAWGNPRGYAIHPGPLVHLTNLDSKRTENNVNWAKHHLAVSRRKEHEPSSSSMWNINLPGAPPVNFYKFFDNETIDQEDLVVWVNLGTHHIPRAEDSPNTLTNLATSYVLLAPWNFNDHDVSMESRNSVLLNGEGNWVIEEAVKPPQCVPSTPPPLEYHGTIVFGEDGSPVEDDSPEYAEMIGKMDSGIWGWHDQL